MGAITTTNQTDQPRIYVACRAAYNQGRLHGAWIDAAQEPWALWEAVQAMLAASPVAGAEEWAIHDHEGFGGVRIHESEGFDTVTTLAAFIAEHGAVGAALLHYFDGDIEEARAAMTNAYAGRYASLADYMERTGGRISMTVPPRVLCYTDWQAMADEAEAFGDLFTIPADDGGVYVFEVY